MTTAQMHAIGELAAHYGRYPGLKTVWCEYGDGAVRFEAHYRVPVDASDLEGTFPEHQAHWVAVDGSESRWQDRAERFSGSFDSGPALAGQTTKLGSRRLCRPSPGNGRDELPMHEGSYMSNVRPLPAGHYRLRYASMSRVELEVARARIPDQFNRSTADAVDLMAIEDALAKLQRCWCPDDCNCRKPWRTNYCGCNRHGS